MSIGLDEKLPQDYRLAQQVCHAIANISDRRKVCGVVTATLRGVGGSSYLPSTHPHTIFPVLNSHLWTNVTLPSGCLRNTGCLSDYRRWSLKVSYHEEPWAELSSLSAVATPLFSHSGFIHPDPLWIPFKEVAVTLIYQLAEGPEGICAQILQGCAKQALEKLEEKSNPQDDPSKWSWVTGPRGQQRASAFPAGKKPLPPPLPTTADPLSLHCHIFVTHVGPVTTTIPHPTTTSLASLLVCVAHEQGAGQ